MMIQYREFEGPAMITIGGGMMKITSEKTKPTFFIFLARFSSPIECPATIAMGTRGRERGEGGMVG